MALGPGGGGGVIIGPGVGGLTAGQVEAIVSAHSNNIITAFNQSLFIVQNNIIQSLVPLNQNLIMLNSRFDATLIGLNNLTVGFVNLSNSLLNLVSTNILAFQSLSMGLTNLAFGFNNMGAGFATLGLGLNNLSMSLLNIGSALMFDAQIRAQLQPAWQRFLAIIPDAGITFQAMLQQLTDPDERRRLIRELVSVLISISNEIFGPLAEPFQTMINELAVEVQALGSAISTSDAGGVLAKMSQIYNKYVEIAAKTIAAGLTLEIFSVGQIDQIARAIFDALGLIPFSTAVHDLFYLEYNVGVRPKLIHAFQAKHMPSLPSASDLITMVVREAFDPAFVTPAPEVFKQFMKLQGFSEEWADRYWTAHWKWVPNETAIEMFHRGIISQEDLVRTFLINDIHPRTVEWWTRFIYRLPNRVEARIMGRFGLLTEEQMDRILKAEGIDPEFIPALRTMIFEYHLGSVQTKIESFAISAYEDGMISADVFRQWMTVARFPNSVIEMALTLANYKRFVELQDRKRKLIKEWAKKGYLSYDEAAQALQSLAIEPDVLSLDLEEIRVHRLIGEERELEGFRERLVQAAISAYDDGLLNTTEFINVLKAANLPEHLVQAYAQLAQYRRVWGLRAEIIKAYVGMYRRGVIDFSGALQGMINAGIDPEFAQAKLLAVKQVVETVKPPKIDLPGDKLTVKQIFDALNTGVITIDEAVEFLRNKGYDPTEIAVIMNTWVLKQRT